MVADLFLFYYYYFFACRILVPQARIEPLPPVVEAQSLNHWTTGEVPDFFVELVETFSQRLEGEAVSMWLWWGAAHQEEGTASVKTPWRSIKKAQDGTSLEILAKTVHF